MGHKIDIQQLRLGGLGRRAVPSVSRPMRIEDSFESVEEQAPVAYKHIFYHAKDEGLYPGLKQITAMPGDTFFGILLRQGFQTREISRHNLVEVAAQLNGMEVKDVLRIGTPLVVPGREFLESIAC